MNNNPVGRSKEIDEINDLLMNGKSVLIHSERGMGKSTLLEQLSKELASKDDCIIGYLDHKKALDEDNHIYPFVCVLNELISNIIEKEDKNKMNLRKLNNALTKATKNSRGIPLRIAKAFIHQALENYIGGTVVEELDSIKQELSDASPETLADKFIKNNNQSVTLEYIEILRNLSEEYNNKTFVLILDEFDKFPMSSSKFLCGLLRASRDFPQRNINMVVSFTWPNAAVKNEDTTPKFNKLNMEFLEENCAVKELEGLLKDDVKALADGLGLNLDNEQISIITNKSGGIPIVIDAWLRELCQKRRITENDLIVPERNLELLYSLFKKEHSSLDSDSQKFTSILSVIEKGLRLTQCTDFISRCYGYKIDPLDFNIKIINSLCENNFFKEFEEIKWFRHQLLQYCIRDKILEKDLYLQYNRCAAKFLEECKFS